MDYVAQNCHYGEHWGGLRSSIHCMGFFYTIFWAIDILVETPADCAIMGVCSSLQFISLKNSL